MKTRVFEVSVWHSTVTKEPYACFWRYDKRAKFGMRPRYTEKITKASATRIRRVFADVGPEHVGIGKDYVMVQYNVK
jgi:hypothetical protein